MERVNYYNLVIAVILSSITNTTGYEVTNEALQKTTAMNLIFLKIYEVQNSKYKESAVKYSHHAEFMDTWGDILGENDAKEVYQRIEPHLAYFKWQATSSGTDFSAVIVALNIKIMALIQGTSYLICVIYYKRAYNEFTPEHCRNLAAYLLIFSNLVTRELIEKLLLETKPALGYYKQHIFSAFPNDSDAITVVSRDFLQPNVQSSYYPPTDAPKLSFEDSELLFYNIMHNEVIVPGRAVLLFEDLSLRTMFGNFGALSSGYIGYLRIIGREMLFWQKSININETLIHSYSEDTNLADRAMSYVIQEIVVIRFAVCEIQRRDYIERFERMLMRVPEFNIHLKRNDFITNIQLEDDL